MLWESFHFACRYASQKVADNQSLQKVLAQFNKDYPSHKTPTEALLFSKIQMQTVPSEQAELLSIYGRLDFSPKSNYRHKYQSIRLYLLLLFTFYTFSSIVINVYVVPSLTNVIPTEDVNEGVFSLGFVSSWWLFLSITIIISMLINIAFHSHVDTIVREQGNHHPIRYRAWLLSKKAVELHQELSGLIFAPVSDSACAEMGESAQFIKQLKKDELDIAAELQLAYDKKQLAFSEQITKRAKQITAITGIFLILAIFHLLSSIYLPILTSGNAIL